MSSRKRQKTEYDFDKRSIPGILVFVVLLVIGFTVFFYWRSHRSITTAEEPATVAATIFPIYDITRNIVGDDTDFELIQIVPSDTDPESFQPTALSYQPDIVFKLGAGFDDWVSDISDDARIVDLSEAVDLIKTSLNADYQTICEENNGTWLSEYSECEGITEEVCTENNGEYNGCASACRHEQDTGSCIQMCIQVCEFNTDQVEDEYTSEEYNPYYWLSIENAKKMSEKIYEELAALRSESADQLKTNLDNYLQILDEAKLEIVNSEVVNSEIGKKLITYRNNLVYFTSEYDLEILATFEEYAGQEVPEEYLAEIEELMDENNIDTIYIDTFSGREVIEELKWDKVVEIRELDIVGGGESNGSYVDLMRELIEQMKNPSASSGQAD